MTSSSTPKTLRYLNECPTCGAHGAEPCVSRTGRRLATVHANRKESAKNTENRQKTLDLD